MDKKAVLILIALFSALALSACGSSSGGGGGSSQTVPTVPSSVVASTLSESGIRITWIDNSDNEDGFRVERSLDSVVGFAEIMTTSPTSPDVTMVDDNGLNADTTYYYRIASFNSIGDSAYSNVANATTNQSSSSPPAAPTNLQGSALSSSTIQLTWNDNATNESNYAVMHASYSGSCGTFSEIALLSPDTVAYIHSGLSAASSNCYQIEARNSFGTGLSSVISNIATSSTFTLTVIKTGTGSGTVTGSGINCGTDCNEVVDAGTSVTLTASAGINSLFNGWSGCDRVSAGAQCTVLGVNANRTVTANFEDTSL